MAPMRDHARHRRRRRQQQPYHLMLALWLFVPLLSRAAAQRPQSIATVGPARITPINSTDPPSRAPPTAAAAYTTANEAGTTTTDAERAAVDSVNASDVAAVLSAIGSTDCPRESRTTIAKLFAANAVLLDTCRTESGYALYPYAGYFPRSDAIAKVCASPSCMDLLSGLVLAKVPECDVDAYSPRSLAEALFRVRVDLANGRAAPTTSAFAELYALNKVVNVLQTNVTARARVTPRFAVATVASAMNAVEINPDVVLGTNLVIYVQAPSAASSNSSSSSSKATESNGSRVNSTHNTVGDSGDGGKRASVAPTAESTTGGSDRTGDSVSLAYFFVAFVWLAVNGGYFMLMSIQD